MARTGITRTLCESKTLTLWHSPDDGDAITAKFTDGSKADRKLQWQQTVDVRDFGAVPNDVSAASGNVVAFNTALALIKSLGGGTLQVPVGTFYINATVGVTNCPNLKIAGDRPDFTQGRTGTWLKATSSMTGVLLDLLGVPLCKVYDIGFDGSDDGGTIVSATNTTPIVLTTSDAHGLTTGATVFPASITTTTGVNGAQWAITRISATQFSLDGSVAGGAGTGGTYQVMRASTGLRVAANNSTVGTIKAEINMCCALNAGIGFHVGDTSNKQCDNVVVSHSLTRGCDVGIQQDGGQTVNCKYENTILTLIGSTCKGLVVVSGDVSTQNLNLEMSPVGATTTSVGIEIQATAAWDRHRDAYFECQGGTAFSYPADPGHILGRTWSTLWDGVTIQYAQGATGISNGNRIVKYGQNGAFTTVNTIYRINSVSDVAQLDLHYDSTFAETPVFIEVQPQYPPGSVFAPDVTTGLHYTAIGGTNPPTSAIYAQTGTFAAPSYTFAASSDVGMHLVSTAGGIGVGGLSAGGQRPFEWGQDYTQLRSPNFSVRNVAVQPRPAAYTYNFNPGATRTLDNWTPSSYSSAFTGIATGVGGTPYAQLTDLNALRAEVEKLRLWLPTLAGVVVTGHTDDFNQGLK